MNIKLDEVPIILKKGDIALICIVILTFVIVMTHLITRLVDENKLTVSQNQTEMAISAGKECQRGWASDRVLINSAARDSLTHNFGKGGN